MVHSVVCALIVVLSGQVAFEPSVVPTEPRELYQLAAAAIASRDTATATRHLENLAFNHTNSPLAEVAVFHLAECYLLQSRSADALSVLHKFSERIEQSLSVEQKEPGIKSKTNELLTRVLQSFPEDPQSLQTLQRQITAHESIDSDQLSTPVDVAIAGELAQRYERSQDFASAEQWLQKLVGTVGSDARQLEEKLRFELPLAKAEHALSVGEAGAAVEILQTALTAQHESDQELALRFLLAEALFATGKSTAAAEQFQWLSEQAATQIPSPAWLAAVTLRRAELLVRTRAFVEAQSLLLRAKTDLPDFELVHEFDYLLARCAVARIEFDKAIELLQRVIEAPTAAGKEAIPRAAWMLGEVHFLQRQYRPALTAYAQATQLDAFPQWQARGLLQSAKCYELLGDTPAALGFYQRAKELSQRPDVIQEATERMAVIESAASNLR